MSIEGLQSSYLYQNPRFLQATKPYENGNFQPHERAVQNVNYPNYNFIPSTDDMERASAYLEGVSGVDANIFAQRPQHVQSGLQGEAFEGFTVPKQNANHELSPVIAGRETAIEGCPWEAYYA